MRPHGRHFAMSIGMIKHVTRDSGLERRLPASSLTRIIERVVGTSMVSLGFGLAVLAIGMPVALSMWLAIGSGAWIAHATGATSGVSAAFLWMLSTAGGLLLAAFVARGAYQLIRRAVLHSDRRGEPHRTIHTGTDSHHLSEAGRRLTWSY